MKSIIADVAEIILKRISDNKIILIAETQLASISQKVTEEKIKGGRGNALISLLRTGREIDFTVKNAVFDTDYLEMISGMSFVDETNTVIKKEDGLQVEERFFYDTDEIDDTREINDMYEFDEKDSISALFKYLFDVDTNNKIPVSYEPKAGELILIINYDDSTRYIDGTYSNGYVYLIGDISDEYLIAVYQIDVNGKALNLTTDGFAEDYYAELRTIEYDLSANQVVRDIYFIFNKVTPSGNFELSFEKGVALTPEMQFYVLGEKNSSEIGKIIEVERN